MPNRAEILKQKYQDSLDLPFAQVLSEREIKQVLNTQNVKYRQVLYTPIVVLWAWISQVVDPDKSLSHAVKGAMQKTPCVDVETNGSKYPLSMSESDRRTMGH